MPFTDDGLQLLWLGRAMFLKAHEIQLFNEYIKNLTDQLVERIGNGAWRRLHQSAGSGIDYGVVVPTGIGAYPEIKLRITDNKHYLNIGEEKRLGIIISIVRKDSRLSREVIDNSAKFIHLANPHAIDVLEEHARHLISICLSRYSRLLDEKEAHANNILKSTKTSRKEVKKARNLLSKADKDRVTIKSLVETISHESHR